MNRLAIVGLVGAALALALLTGFAYGVNPPARTHGLVWDGSYPIVAQGRQPC